MRTFTALMLAGLAAAGLLVLIGGMPFDLPMPTQRFGVVEPSCGLTRGSTAIARGDLARAWAYNPASFVVMGFGALGAARAVVGGLTARWMTVRVTWTRWSVLALAAAITLLWAYQQTNAEFIINARG